MEHLCDTTDLCEDYQKEIIVKVYDIVEIEEKMYELRRNLQDARSNIRFFQGTIKTTEQEIVRLQSKLDYLGQ